MVLLLYGLLLRACEVVQVNGFFKAFFVTAGPVVKIEFLQEKIFLGHMQETFNNELHPPFLPYFDTQHLIFEIFSLFVRGSKNSEGKNMNYI